MDQSTASAVADIFVARQPIFDTRHRVFAYELIFRSGPQHSFAAGPGPGAPAPRVISNGMLVHLAKLTAHKPAFVNFSREPLITDAALSLPAKDVIIEIQASVESEEPVLLACQRLKAAGYRLALDAYEDRPERGALVELADFVKVDLVGTSAEQRNAIVQACRPRCPLIAENVQTRQARAEAAAQGFGYFQGYFFSQPTGRPARTIPGYRLNYLRLLRELNRPEVDMRRLEEVVKQEASITFRLLRRVNSAAYGFRVETSSLRHALVLLGEREIRLCATVWALADLANEVPSELVVSSTLRARLCEMLAPHAQLANRAVDLFLLGMFSMVDAILEQPMDQVVGTLPLADDVRNALLGEPNPLRSVLECAKAYEQGRWEQVTETAAASGIAETEIPSCYLEAVEWTREIFQPT